MVTAKERRSKYTKFKITIRKNKLGKEKSKFLCWQVGLEKNFQLLLI
jgi:hypothetical protein